MKHKSSLTPSASKSVVSGKLSKRSRARMLAMQGLYQWLMTGYDQSTIAAQLREEPGFNKADQDCFNRLFVGAMQAVSSLETLLAPHLDRAVNELTPIERAILLVGCFELHHCIDVPFQVVINEAVELAKRFGGSDAHRYVNGVLHGLAQKLRTLETTRALSC